MTVREVGHKKASSVKHQKTSLYKTTVAYLSSTASRAGKQQSLVIPQISSDQGLSSPHLGQTASSHVDMLTRVWDFRQQLVEQATMLGCAGVQKPLQSDDKLVVKLLNDTIPTREEEVLALRGGTAVGFLNLLDAVLHPNDEALDRIFLKMPSGRLSEFRMKMRRLAARLAEASEEIPSRTYLKGLTMDRLSPVSGGGHGDIFKGSLHERTVVAVKSLRAFSVSGPKDQVMKILYRELVVIRSLQHKHICPLLGIDNSMTPSRVVGLILPWMALGNVETHIANVGWTEPEARRFIIETLCGLAYLHSQEVVHGNLHQGNILIGAEANVFLADFGLSDFVDSLKSDGGSTLVGTPRHIAPEILLPDSGGNTKERHTGASDMYAFGQVAWQIYTGLLPLHDMNHHSVPFAIVEGRHPERLLSPRQIPDTLWNAMESCWKLQPRERPQADPLLKDLRKSFAGAKHTDSREGQEKPSSESDLRFEMRQRNATQEKPLPAKPLRSKSAAERRERGEHTRSLLSSIWKFLTAHFRSRPRS